MTRYELSLSPDYVPTWTIVDAAREFIQNAIDQETKNPDNKMYISFEGDTLSVKSANTSLSTSSLLLGSTTKANDKVTIGQFGEGYKIAALVARRLGKAVTIYNSLKQEVWHTNFVTVKKYDGAKVLAFEVESVKASYFDFNGLDIQVVGISEDEKQCIINSNLYLIEQYEGTIGETIQVRQGQILLDESFKGMIFVRGLYVCDLDKFSVGYNINPEHLVLGRDRQLVNSFDVQWITSSMWGDSKSVKLVDLVRDKAPDVSYLENASYHRIDSEVAKVAYETFTEEHGVGAVAVSTNAELQMAKTMAPKANIVLIDAGYKKLVVASPEYVANIDSIEDEDDDSPRVQWLTWLADNKNSLGNYQITSFLAILNELYPVTEDEEDE